MEPEGTPCDSMRMVCPDIPTVDCLPDLLAVIAICSTKLGHFMLRV